LPTTYSFPFASVISIPGEGLEGASLTSDNGNSKVYPGRSEVYVAQPKVDMVDEIIEAHGEAMPKGVRTAARKPLR
jgi:hypothetical protein